MAFLRLIQTGSPPQICNSFDESRQINTEIAISGTQRQRDNFRQHPEWIYIQRINCLRDDIVYETNYIFPFWDFPVSLKGIRKADYVIGTKVNLVRLIQLINDEGYSNQMSVTYCFLISARWLTMKIDFLFSAGIGWRNNIRYMKHILNLRCAPQIEFAETYPNYILLAVLRQTFPTNSTHG